MQDIRGILGSKSHHIIAIISIIVFSVSAYCLSAGITPIYLYLLYIPIILVSYYHPKWGVRFAGFISLVFLLSLLILPDINSGIIISTVILGILFILAGIVVSYLSVIHRDAINEFRMNKKRCMELFRNIGSGIAIIGRRDDDGEFILQNINKKGMSLANLTEEEFSGAGLNIREVPWLNLYDEINEVSDSGRELQFIRKNINEGGICEWMEYSVYNIPSGEIIIVFDDITERKKQEEELNYSEKRLKMALKAAKLNLFDYSLDDKTITISKENRNINDLFPESLTLNEFYEYIYPDDQEILKAELNKILNKEQNYLSSVQRIQAHDGDLRWYMILGEITEFSESYGQKRLIGISQDITDLKKYQESVEEANKKLNLLASVTRHDILNQVSALILYNRLLEDRIPPEDEDSRDYIDKLDMISTTIQKQISFTKEYHNLGVNAPSWQSINEIIAQEEHIAYSVGLMVEDKVDSVEIFADQMINKVFYNLFENSGKYAEGAEKITVSFLPEDDGRGRIIVEDNGSGIPDDKKEMIFKRGYGKNTGFGLFLTKEILDITNISIAERGVLNNGARFEIIIPEKRWRYS